MMLMWFLVRKLFVFAVSFAVVVLICALTVNSFWPIVLPTDEPPVATDLTTHEEKVNPSPCPVEGDVKICVWKYGYEVCKCYPE